eukprot:CAMPEP_0113851970 /NCGR_PEP_ID=MMETSP0372-20130328/5086_1 /TAXON_ID=340204 /ORGANISM="Lankesteria abbotti" /LENGTH=83 /DNA_ID=CAMNT_0000823139 /DNA_START=26 /DNA_END=273 /DNA_ORIENTATION=- /assembly_acc=CAM_ASM_000359
MADWMVLEHSTYDDNRDMSHALVNSDDVMDVDVVMTLVNSVMDVVDTTGVDVVMTYVDMMDEIDVIDSVVVVTGTMVRVFDMR